MSRLHPLTLLPIDVILLLLPPWRPQPQQWAGRDNNRLNLIILHPYCSPSRISTPLKGLPPLKYYNKLELMFFFAKIKLCFDLNLNLILQENETKKPRSMRRGPGHALFLLLSASTHLWKLYITLTLHCHGKRPDREWQQFSVFILGIIYCQNSSPSKL